MDNTADHAIDEALSAITELCSFTFDYPPSDSDSSSTTNPTVQSFQSSSTISGNGGLFNLPSPELTPPSPPTIPNFVSSSSSSPSLPVLPSPCNSPSTESDVHIDDLLHNSLPEPSYRSSSAPISPPTAPLHRLSSSRQFATSRRSFSTSSRTGCSFFLVTEDLLIEYLTGPSPPDSFDLKVFLYSIPVIISVFDFFELLSFRIKCTLGVLEEGQFPKIETVDVQSKAVVLRCFNLILTWLRDHFEPSLIDFDRSLLNFLADFKSVADFLKLQSISNEFTLIINRFVKFNISEFPFEDYIFIPTIAEKELYFQKLANIILKERAINQISHHVAGFLTRIDIDLIEKLPPKLLLLISQQKALNRPISNNSSYKLLVTRFESFVSWPVHLIQTFNSNKSDQIKLFKFIIEIVFELVKLNNYNSLLAIVTGLKSTAIQKQNHLWSSLSRKQRSKLTNLFDIFDVRNNFCNLRQVFSDLSKSKANSYCVPWFGLFVNDVVFILLSQDAIVSSEVINFSKFSKIYSIVNNFEILFNSFNSF
ncbi:hypothetical protein P9112_002771 [Eukaryota sp. TZLM1-RC]